MPAKRLCQSPIIRGEDVDILVKATGNEERPRILQLKVTLVVLHWSQSAVLTLEPPNIGNISLVGPDLAILPHHSYIPAFDPSIRSSGQDSVSVIAPVQSVNVFDVAIENHDCPASAQVPYPTNTVKSSAGEQTSIRVEAQCVDFP